MNRTSLCAVLPLVALLSAPAPVSAGGGGGYEVTITNVTRGQTFTPILVASHRGGVRLFELGAEAGADIATLAEGGNTDPLQERLEADPRVAGIASTGALLVPGASATVSVPAGHARYLSLAGMLIPTNDAFMSLNHVRAPRHGSVTYRVLAYDAGSEPNDEMCVNIPGPVCGGAGPSPEEGGEGYVHVHAGIHGIGDLAAAAYDWRNPVAVVRITRVHH